MIHNYNSLRIFIKYIQQKPEYITCIMHYADGARIKEILSLYSNVIYTNILTILPNLHLCNVHRRYHTLSKNLRVSSKNEISLFFFFLQFKKITKNFNYYTHQFKSHICSTMCNRTNYNNRCFPIVLYPYANPINIFQRFCLLNGF